MRIRMMGMRLTVPLSDDDDAALSALAAAAGVGKAGWIRGAIRAATAQSDIADQVASSADQQRWGGRRPGAGRPARIGGEGEGVSDD